MRKSGITDAGPRLRAMNDALEEIDRLRKREAELLAAGDRLESQLCEAARERDRLRLAIRRLAEQDATLSVCDGNVTVTMDATLTDAEREAIATAARIAGAVGESDIKATLKSFLKRLSSSTPISGAGQSTETGKK